MTCGLAGSLLSIPVTVIAWLAGIELGFVEAKFLDHPVPKLLHGALIPEFIAVDAHDYAVAILQFRSQVEHRGVIDLVSGCRRPPAGLPESSTEVPKPG